MFNNCESLTVISAWTYNNFIVYCFSLCNVKYKYEVHG